MKQDGTYGIDLVVHAEKVDLIRVDQHGKPKDARDGLVEDGAATHDWHRDSGDSEFDTVVVATMANKIIPSQLQACDRINRTGGYLNKFIYQAPHMNDKIANEGRADRRATGADDHKTS